MRKSKRVSIGVKLRFEILSRFGYQCVYCGGKAPDVVLHVDHRIPVSKGGTNDIGNLVAACFSCNIGKGVKTVEHIPVIGSFDPAKIAETVRLMDEKRVQLNGEREAIEEMALCLLEDWARLYDLLDGKDFLFTDEMEHVVNVFITKLPGGEIVEAMHITKRRFPKDDKEAQRYFCGVCWNKIKDANQANQAKQLQCT